MTLERKLTCPLSQQYILSHPLYNKHSFKFSSAIGIIKEMATSQMLLISSIWTANIFLLFKLLALQKCNFHFLTNIVFRQMGRWNVVEVVHQWIGRKPGDGQRKGINHLKLHGYISLWVNFQVSGVKIVVTGAIWIFMPRPGIAAKCICSSFGTTDTDWI